MEKRCAGDEVVWVNETLFWVGGGCMGHYFGWVGVSEGKRGIILDR